MTQESDRLQEQLAHIATLTDRGDRRFEELNLRRGEATIKVAVAKS